MNKTRKEDTQGRRLSKRRIVVVVVPPVGARASLISQAPRRSRATQRLLGLTSL
jgi:hypothetical protein